MKMTQMNILIAYDFSECSTCALEDLAVAGLPSDVRAHVMSVAEVWLPPPDADISMTAYVDELRSKPQRFAGWQSGAKMVARSEIWAKTAKERLEKLYPQWSVSYEGTYGSPTWEILSKATKLGSDLIVAGSHGHSALANTFLGSVSQKILNEADCSVRIGRGSVPANPKPNRIVIGYDASEGSDDAVLSVASRSWPDGTDIRLVVVVQPPNEYDRSQRYDLEDFAERLTSKAKTTLRAAGLETEVVADVGHPKERLIQFADRWGADCIFLGANNSGSRFAKYWLGSVASAVAARANCSVEVVRRRATTGGLI